MKLRTAAAGQSILEQLAQEDRATQSRINYHELGPALCLLVAARPGIASHGPESTAQVGALSSQLLAHFVESLAGYLHDVESFKDIDNVFIERLWRSLKCELIYLSSYDNLHELEAAITRWMNDYNHHRIHQTLGYTTPWENYRPADGLGTTA